MWFLPIVPPGLLSFQAADIQTPTLTAQYRIKDLSTKAEKGDASAALDLADLYENGDGVPKDPAQAYAWFSKAANLGSVRGLEMAGWHEVSGAGTAFDPAKALESFRKATAAGSGYAAQQIGWMYEKGKGVPHDDAQAVQWYQRAIQQGEMDACGALGWLTETGRGTQKDLAAAAKLYYLGAQAGDSASQDNLGWLCVTGNGVSQKNYPLAMSLFQKAAAQGNARAEGNIGYLYAHGLGVPLDKVEALRWFRSSADHGDLKSQSHLGDVFLNGELGPRDPSNCLHYAMLAAKQGNEGSFSTLTVQILSLPTTAPVGMKDVFTFLLDRADKQEPGAVIPLGLCYLKGLGTQGDLVAAKTWLLKGAQDQARSSFLLPICQWLNAGVNGYPKDPALAHDLLHAISQAGNAKAATMSALLEGDPSKSVEELRALARGGDSMAAYELGLHYQNGDHLPSNPKLALKLFEESAAEGNMVAMYHLGVLYQGGILVKHDPSKAIAWYQKAKAAGFPPAAARFNEDGSLRPLDDSKVIVTTVTTNTP